jgi:hypothetical protein
MMMRMESGDRMPQPRPRTVALDRTAEPTVRARDSLAARDRVADASDDSFPASDPPSWTGISVGPTR